MYALLKFVNDLSNTFKDKTFIVGLFLDLQNALNLIKNFKVFEFSHINS